ncbi:MAG: hypothetical protein K0Q68_1201 [Moraxellaceae bacterium]|nr:hypothetical protein [Moraxellaceae bacterium]
MAVSPSKEDNNNNEGTMRPIHYLLPLLLGSLYALPARADTCADLSMQFAGAGRFHMTLGELDELKTCINLILREKISATSNEARGATSPPVAGAGATLEARRPRALPVLQDAE